MGQLAAGLVRSCPSLVRLDLRYNDLGEGGAAALAGALREGTAAAAAAAAAAVAVLHLEGNGIGDGGCASLAAAVSPGKREGALEELYLGANGIGPKGAACLAGGLEAGGGLRGLRTLFLEGNRIGPGGAEVLAGALEGLWAEAEEEAGRGGREGGEAPAISLRHLYVDNNGCGKEGMQRIAAALNSGSTIRGLEGEGAI